MPSVAPALGEIIRISASEIEVHWSPLLEEEEGSEVSTYLIKYRPIQTVRKRNEDDLATVVETNATSFVISELDPRYAYAVSVAASNRGGVGQYSQEVTVGCECRGMQPCVAVCVFTCSMLLSLQCLIAAILWSTWLEL